jgi:Tfp pilus assembly protein PilN
MSQEINLVNPAFAEKSKALSFVGMLLGLGVLVVFMLLYYAVSAYQADALRRAAADALKIQALKQAQLARIVESYKPRQKDQQLVDEVAQLETEVKSRDHALSILKTSDLDNIHGYSRYMEAFARQIIPGLWLTGFSISGKEIDIQGRTLSPDLVPAYINRLDKEDVMRGITFASLEMQLPEKAANYLEFSLQSNGAGK